ncbi:methionyl-tRNA formyltransferase, partial [Corynebacterium tapiri]
VVALEKLIASDHEVVAVITRPDARRGRGRTLHPSPVAELAQDHGIEVLKPETLKAGTPDGDEIRTRLGQLQPDAVPIVAYGGLVPADLLDYTWVNLHFSLLPRWRGAAPVQAAIRAGDARTGATTFRLAEGLDTGDILAQVEEQIAPEDTADDLLTRLAYQGGDLLVETMDGLARNGITPRAQIGEASYAGKISTADAKVDVTADAEVIDREIRAHTPAPGAWVQWNDQRLKLGPVRPLVQADVELDPGELHVAKSEVLLGTGSTPVRLGQVQAQGKKRMNAADWARGLAADAPRKVQ